MCRWIVLLFSLGSCVTVDSLERSAVRHDRRSEHLAELGDGAGAALEANRADSDHAAARRLAESRGPWATDLFLR
jgi:hypothetical protein